MPDDLLTQEELLALEAEVEANQQRNLQALQEQAAQARSVAAPIPHNAYGAPAILPPGPSPEFLRRQLMSSKLQPGTGMLSGPNGTWTVVGPPPPSGEEQMMEQIRQQINAMEFKNANDALNAAIQFQHMREAQRLRSSGTPEEQILQRLGRGLFYQQPNVLPSMMRETRPVPAPSITNIDGVPVLRSGLRGERATAVPRTALKPDEFKPEIVDLGDGERVVQLGPNRYQYLKPVSEKDTPPAVRERILKHQIEQAQAAIQSLPTAIMPSAREAKAKQREELERQIKEANDALNAMVYGKAKPAAVEPAPITAPATPRTQAEYDSLPSGSYYVDPTSKATKRKK